MRILYFAALREALGREGEEVDLPAGSTLADLIKQLGERPGWSTACAAAGQVRAAVDQEFAAPDCPLRDGCEVGLFPPVTGG